jgi:hypothetical protein
VDHSNDGAETELYLVRIWAERSGDAAGARPLHGKVQHVVSGEALNFRGYKGLAEAIEKMLAERENDWQHTADE